MGLGKLIKLTLDCPRLELGGTGGRMHFIALMSTWLIHLTRENLAARKFIKEDSLVDDDEKFI